MKGYTSQLLADKAAWADPIKIGNADFFLLMALFLLISWSSFFNWAGIFSFNSVFYATE
ncbi:MAG: hypothetical protein ACI8ZM_000962 [Crocinitomix sp.]|jgi:hypothetical protein